MSTMSTVSSVTMVSQKGKHRREHSFKKQPIQPQYVQHTIYGQQVHNNLPPTNQTSTHNQHTQFPYNPNLPISQNHNNNNHHNNNQHQNGLNGQNIQNNNINGRIQVRPQNISSPKSALTAQIQPQKQHLANQASGQHSGVIQSRNPDGKLVVKQMPYSKKTHV